MLRILDRGRLGGHHQQLPLGCEKEVELVECRSGAQVEQHVLGVQLADVAQEFQLLAVLGVGAAIWFLQKEHHGIGSYYLFTLD